MPQECEYDDRFFPTGKTGDWPDLVQRGEQRGGYASPFRNLRQSPVSTTHFCPPVDRLENVGFVHREIDPVGFTWNETLGELSRIIRFLFSPIPGKGNFSESHRFVVKDPNPPFSGSPAPHRAPCGGGPGRGYHETPPDIQQKSRRTVLENNSLRRVIAPAVDQSQGIGMRIFQNREDDVSLPRLSRCEGSELERIFKISLHIVDHNIRARRVIVHDPHAPFIQRETRILLDILKCYVQDQVPVARPGLGFLQRIGFLFGMQGQVDDRRRGDGWDGAAERLLERRLIERVRLWIIGKCCRTPGDQRVENILVVATGFPGPVGQGLYPRL